MPLIALAVFGTAMAYIVFFKILVRAGASLLFIDGQLVDWFTGRAA